MRLAPRYALTLTLPADGEQVLAGVSGWVNEYQSANLTLRMPDDNDGDFVPNAEDAFPMMWQPQSIPMVTVCPILE